MQGLNAEALAARALLLGADESMAAWHEAAGDLDRLLDLPAELFMARQPPRPPPRPSVPPPRKGGAAAARRARRQRAAAQGPGYGHALT